MEVQARDVWFVCDPNGKPFYGTGQPERDWSCRAFNFSPELDEKDTEQGYTCQQFRMIPIAAFAEHREWVRRLVEAVREARLTLVSDVLDAQDRLEHIREDGEANLSRTESELDAALTPFLEQETATP